jgi:hypothetical protein
MIKEFIQKDIELLKLKQQFGMYKITNDRDIKEAYEKVLTLNDEKVKQLAINGLTNDRYIIELRDYIFTLNEKIKILEEQLENAKSINEIIKEAFDAGRIGIDITPEGENEFKFYLNKTEDSYEKYKFETFEDYLKTIKI